MGGFRRHMLGIADPDRADEWTGQALAALDGTTDAHAALARLAAQQRRVGALRRGRLPGRYRRVRTREECRDRWGTPQQVAWADEAFAEAREAGR